MPNITNKEWIDNNNLKIDDLITQASELPDYQDIEPIYGNTNIRLSEDCNILGTTSYGSAVEIKGIDRLGDYIIIGYFKSTYNTAIFKLDDNNVLQRLGAKYHASKAYYETSIVGVDSDNLYFTVVPTNNNIGSLDIFYFNFSTGATGTLFTASLGKYTSSGGFYNVGNGKLYGKNTRQLITFDLVNKSIIANIDLATSLGVHYVNNRKTNTFYVGNYGSTKGFDYIINMNDDRVKQIVTDGDISFVSANGNKIGINNKLYFLNQDLTLGSLITDEIFSAAILDGRNYLDLSEYCTNIYCTSRGEWFKFDDSTNTFSLIYNNASNFKYNTLGWGVCGSYIDGNKFNLPIYDTDYSKLIGYKINNKILYIDTNERITGSYIAQGYSAYDADRVLIQGTMPNNGELNYTPSTSQQTIPAGYTSGGTIGAVSMTEQEIQEAEDIISDLFGEGENE